MTLHYTRFKRLALMEYKKSAKIQNKTKQNITNSSKTYIKFINFSIVM